MNHPDTTLNTRTLRRRRGLLAVAMSLALAAPAVHAETQQTGAFEMVVYGDTTQGKHLVEGEWETALAMNETVSSVRFAALNDRCVTLTVARDLERAEVVCNDAVRAARRSEASRSPGSAYGGVSTDTRISRAMAVTNRGVLRALQGDGDGARKDFETAIKISGRVEAAADNLAVLDAMPGLAGID